MNDQFANRELAYRTNMGTLNPFQKKVLAFLRDPNRSDPEKLFEYLLAWGFFDKSDPEFYSQGLFEYILDHKDTRGKFCEQGIAKAKKELSPRKFKIGDVINSEEGEYLPGGSVVLDKPNEIPWQRNWIDGFDKSGHWVPPNGHSRSRLPASWNYEILFVGRDA